MICEGCNPEVIHEIRGDIKEIKRMLVGNGKIGLIEQVRGHDGFIANALKIIWMFIGIFVIGIGGWVWWGFSVYAKS